MSPTITFWGFFSLTSLSFFCLMSFQTFITALDFVLILHDNNDHQLDYDWPGFRHRPSMQLPGTTDCQVTFIGEDRNQLLEHHEQPNIKSLLLLPREA